MAKGKTKSVKKELKILADDFGLLHRADVQNVIDNCTSYDEGQKKILCIYDMVYMCR